ncbi:hypothetical protein SUGI_0616100 [Cryptomeria japonica]|nr:hypothetical protein SUGI_0616100 [Cryptomeria japonica]
MILSEFDIVYTERKAIKGQVIADQLADAPISDDHPMLTNFLDESVFAFTSSNEWKLYFDGSHTKFGSGAGILFVTPQGDAIPKSYRITFQCTNNIAEYEALVTGLRVAIHWNISHLQVYGDSQLVIRQVNDDYETKDEKLIPYKHMVDFIKTKFTAIHFSQVPRMQNKSADAMATIASMLNMPHNMDKCEFLVKQLLVPSFDIPTADVMCVLVGPNSPWYNDIYQYLKSQTLPPNLSANQHRAFIRQIAKYVIIADTLYRRSFDHTLLRCLDSDEAQMALHEVHDGICGGHFNGLSLAKKLIRAGYYWPTLEKDVHDIVKKCYKCQIHGNYIHTPAQELHSVISPWPFSQWGLDLIDKIQPTSANGHKFIITATEYFTKWIEAIPMTYITGVQISKFLLNYIICRYGVPLAIVTDNGRPFKNKDVKELCEKFHIQHRFSSPYYPQGNGQAEASNKTIIKILKKVVNNASQDWHVQLNPALWAYHTSVRTPTGATPYSLVYGAEAILPLEVEIPSLRVSLQHLIDDATHRVSRLHQLEMLDEKRQTALTHLQAYQNHLRRSYNKKVKG